MELYRTEWNPKREGWDVLKYDLASNRDVPIATFYDHSAKSSISPLAQILCNMLNMLSANMPK